MGSSGVFLGNLLVFDGKYFVDWCVMMNVIFGFQGVEEVVKIGFRELERNEIEEQKAEYKEFKKLDSKAHFLIHQCVDAAIFGKISKATTTNKYWIF